MYLFNRPKDIGNVRLLDTETSWITNFQIIYGVDVEGEKHEITGARVLTLHWFINFPIEGDNMPAYYAFRDACNEFWEEKTKTSGINFIPHK